MVIILLIFHYYWKFKNWIQEVIAKKVTCFLHLCLWEAVHFTVNAKCIKSFQCHFFIIYIYTGSQRAFYYLCETSKMFSHVNLLQPWKFWIGIWIFIRHYSSFAFEFVESRFFIKALVIGLFTVAAQFIRCIITHFKYTSGQNWRNFYFYQIESTLSF